MKKLLFLFMCGIISVQTSAQKQVYIPNEFSDPNNPFHEWSWGKTYQSENFVIFWGNEVGTNPETHQNPDLQFVPSEVAGYLEQSFTKFVTELGLVSNDPSTNFGTYKTVIVMVGTFTNDNGGFATGASYDNTIGAMWVHPNATRDGGTLSHEFVHTLQNVNFIQENTGGGGFINNDASGWFWECHANFMRNQQFPELASGDMPRWLATRHYQLSSTRHHYSSFKWLQHIQSTEGINMVNRLWRESNTGETPVEAFKRLKGFSQTQYNNWMYDYAKREANYDYSAMDFGQQIRDGLNDLKSNPNTNHLVWKEFAILDQVNASNGRYAIPDFLAPQQGGMNIIPLYTTCVSKTVHIKFKGHTEVNSVAGWRWGFVAVKNDGVNVRYGTMQSASDGEASFTLAADESQMYLVVVGAPTTRTDHAWEPGWPKIQRFPYELRIENALPEGYQDNFRGYLKTLYPGAPHSNGGGWVASTASVASSVYVGPKAFVLGNANLSGNVRVEKTARLEGITASGDVLFSGEINVKGGTYLNNAKVLEGAVLMDCNASGNAVLKGNFLSFGSSFGGSGVIAGGDGEIGNCSTAGLYLQSPHPNNGRSSCDGKGASDPSNIDVNSPYSLFTDNQMGWTALGCGGGGTPVDNLGMSATPSTSYVSPWETLAAINDGYTPSNSNDKSNGAYGNWDNPNSLQWVQYDWTENKTITSVDAYWFDDNGGVLTPTTAYLEFWNGTSWINLGSIPLVKNVFNTLGNFEVTTKRLRISMKNTSQSTGILDWRVYGSTPTTVTNLALTATESTSFVSPWETLSAVNDGFTPASSNDKSNGAYGNWDTPNTYQWVQYEWAQTKAITSVEVYWFDDDGGVRTPTEAVVEYWNGSSWINLGGVPLQKDAFNNTSIGLVNSKRIRVRMKNNTQSTGILEFRVWGTTSSFASSMTDPSLKSKLSVQQDSSNGILIYPNPATTRFTINLNGFEQDENVRLEIQDLQGKNIFVENLGKTRNKTFEIAKVGLIGSIYILRAVSNSQTVSQRFIIRN